MMKVWNNSGTMTSDGSCAAASIGNKIQDMLEDLMNKGMSIRDAELVINHEVFIAASIIVTRTRRN